ncbi:MAG: hypothetical protein RIF39_00565 [Cyclobacteriaceae bacterium]
MNRKTFYWIATIVFAIAAVIDFWDGFVPKLVSSVSITLGFALLAFGTGRDNKNQFRMVAYGLFAIAIGAFVYRIITG